ncbi:MAG: 1-(5-phosphoribosyl)-5-[(5-phosphoribosylamino)methylideneamino] imidazole-4-carboxamide isomerase [Thermoleophilia bacterium]|nr:1-(5-phosphoribosyl)-5-[(5-phosphoribosylamino)methylideneamino] imidazole-4-carboxamide isomerase [Thermoleophilia bacterium]
MLVVPQIAFRSSLVASGDALPPVKLVRELSAMGAREIGLLDLDGQLASDVLPEWAQTIVAVAKVPVRFDGRLHDGRQIERLTRAGFASVVVDQSSVFDPILLRWALDLYGSHLVVEVQVDGDYVFDAPPAAFGRELVEVLVDLHFQGVRRLLYRDVTGERVPTKQLLELGDRLPGANFAYQGAVDSVADVAALAELGGLVDAVLVNAEHITSGRIDLTAANAAALGHS